MNELNMTLQMLEDKYGSVSDILETTKVNYLPCDKCTGAMFGDDECDGCKGAMYG